MKMLKHIGRLKDTESKVVVVFMSIPGEETSALVTQVDSLNDLVKDELMDLVESKECQNEKDLGVFLRRKTLRSAGPAGTSVLDWLHKSGRLQKIGTDKVIMIPHPSMHMLLSEVNKLNQAPEAAKPKAEAIAPQGSHTLVKADTEEEKRKVAENLKFEAKMLREDAEAAAKQKEEMANKILNTLGEKPSKVTKSKVAKSKKAVG